MKTTISPSPNTLFYSIIGFFSFVVTSCGSYQNSSYYDSDGIYGNTEVRNTEKIAQNNLFMIVITFVKKCCTNR